MLDNELDNLDNGQGNLSKQTADERINSRQQDVANRLFEIYYNDPVFFTNINNTSIFDFSLKFGTSAAHEVLTSVDFALEIEESDLVKLRKSVATEANSLAEIAALFAAHNEPAKTLLARLSKLDFDEALVKVLNHLDAKLAKRNVRWKIFNHNVRERLIATSVWPLHLATCFVKLKTLRSGTKPIYGPLLVRKVELEVTTAGDLVLSARGYWELNEKLLFIINSSGYDLSEDFNFEDVAGVSAAEQLAKAFKLDFPLEKLTSNFLQLSASLIDVPRLIEMPGIVLGFFEPSGGQLRKMMKTILARNELDDIINPDPQKWLYEKKVTEFMANKGAAIVKIQQTNFSQDKATISALNQDTVIWGPPGTGKSQVITNIIANIFAQGQSALVISQKRAALEVLLERLGPLAKYTFFTLDDRSSDKESFYAPLREFVNFVEARRGLVNVNVPVSPLVSLAEREAIVTLKALKENVKDYESYATFFANFATAKLNVMGSFIKELQALNEASNAFKVGTFLPQSIDELATHNQQVKKGLFKKTYDEAFIKFWEKFQTLVLNYRDSLPLATILTSLKDLDLQTINNFLAATKPLGGTKYVDAANALEELLGELVMARITKESRDSNWLNKYKRFASAVRAGRRLPYGFASDHAQIIRDLFSVIIATPNAPASFFRWERHSYDYAIIDESSQMKLEVGLPILYLAKIKVLVGDPMQMRPSSYFALNFGSGESEIVDYDIPEDANSLLDYGLEKGMYGVILDKNYRANFADLMSFSSREFYDAQLDTVTSATLSGVAIEVVDVKGTWENGVNRIEVAAVIDALHENIKAYQKIIVLAFNVKQKDLIIEEVATNHSTIFDAIKSGQVLVRNIENIQGDEADLVIATVIYDKTAAFSSTYVARPGGRNALNVAITRAKDKMIVFKSLNATDVGAKTPDLLTFKRWLEFLELDHQAKIGYAARDLKTKNHAVANSAHEVRLVNALQKVAHERHLELLPSLTVGSVVVDYAFVNPLLANKFVLGVMVDRHTYCKAVNALDNYLQMASQHEYLALKKYRVFCLREMAWLVNPDHELAQIAASVDLAT